MNFPGNDNLGQQGELLSKAVLGDVKARDATRSDPQRRYRTIGWWPQPGTVAKFILIALGVIVLIGWLLTALNH